jgi:membrane-associated phospholipid phosphatase
MTEDLRIRPVDGITYLALLALTVATLASRPPDPPGLPLVAKYAGLALALTLLWWFDRGQSLPLRLLHAFYPVIFLPILFDSFADLLPWVSPVERDAVLIRLDYALLGTHPTVWLERYTHSLVTEVLTWAYTAYYFLPVLLAAALYRWGTLEEFDRAVFGLVLCFYLSYVGYFLVPAVGPRYTLTQLQTVDLTGVFAADAIRETLDALERFKQDAFPSGHTAVVLLVLFYAWGSLRRLFWLFLPVVVALIVSTVYLRYHYVVDVLAGIGLAVLCPLIVRAVLARWPRPQTGDR